MSTGLTASLYEGKQVSFQEFVMRCARAFSSLIDMRDESLDAMIPDEFQPSDYHSDAIEMAKKRLAKVEKWSDERADREAKKVYDREVRSSEEDVKKSARIAQNYMAMLKQVGKWDPPTKNHDSLKKFMIEQLVESIESDCSYALAMPWRLSGKQYRSRLIKNARWDIAYHTKEYEKEVLSAREKTEWVRALRHSLDALKKDKD